MLILALVFVSGLVFGSFAGAQVWRIRVRQLEEDNAAGEKIDKGEYKRLKPLHGRSLHNDRSICLHCGHQLAWYDLLPLVSWLSVGGKCRYCQKRIGLYEPLVELSTAILFTLFYVQYQAVFPATSILEFLLWMVTITGLIVLFVYDMKWFLLPNLVVLPLIGIALAIASLRIVGSTDIWASFQQTAGAVAILGGLYYVLYYYSRFRYGEEGTWVGFGDVKLGFVLGLLLGRWDLAFVALLAANITGVLSVLPSLIQKKLTMKTHIPFGPMLIIGFFFALFVGNATIQWYLQAGTRLFG